MRFLLMVLSVLACRLAVAEPLYDPSGYVVKGNESYREGDFQSAKEYYLDAIRREATNGDIYYNLGNTYFRLGNFGSAIASYRKAKKQLPRDPDIEANLKLARIQTIDKLEEETADASSLVNKLLVFSSLFSYYEMKLIGLVLYCFFWIFLVAEAFTRKPMLKQLSTITLFSAVIWLALTFCSSPGRDGTREFSFPAFTRKASSAVVTTAEAKAYSGDSENFQVVFVLHNGAEIEIEEVRSDWVEVVLPKGRRGWIKSDRLELL